MAQGDIDIAADSGRGPAYYLTVAHRDAYRLAAIETGGIYPYRFTRKDPADRQGFEASLGEPSLVSVDGDAVLRGEVVEGRE